jgi:hypothetical protein
VSEERGALLPLRGCGECLIEAQHAGGRLVETRRPMPGQEALGGPPTDGVATVRGPEWTRHGYAGRTHPFHYLRRPGGLARSSDGASTARSQRQPSPQAPPSASGEACETWNPARMAVGGADLPVPVSCCGEVLVGVSDMAHTLTPTPGHDPRTHLRTGRTCRSEYSSAGWRVGRVSPRSGSLRTSLASPSLRPCG